MSRRGLVLLLCLGVTAALGATGLAPYVGRWLAVDGCLDRGGRWDEAAGACQSTPLSSRQAPGSDTSTLQPERGAIVPASAGPGLLRQCSRPAPDAPEPGGFWIPLQRQVAAFDSALAPLLRSRLAAAASDARPAAPISTYYRQYIGIELGRRRVIYANGFHGFLLQVPGERAEAWRTAAVVACDGGEAFFGAVFDPATRTVVRLDFNGDV